MASLYCYVCEQRTLELGQPSHARWVGPDGKAYCSMHFTQRFGHGEKLVRVDGYEAPAKRKPPAPKQGTRHRRKRTSTLGSEKPVKS